MDLRKLRAERGFTQDELAALSGVSRPAIHRIENGQQAPRRGTVKKLAAARWGSHPGRLPQSCSRSRVASPQA